MHRDPSATPTTTFSHPARAFVSLAILAALSSGCAIDEDFDHEAPETLERDGVQYERLGPIIEEPDAGEAAPDSAAGPNEVQPSIEPLQLDAEPTLAALSREQLADQLRPVIATGEGGGQIYIASEPNWAAADAVLAGDGQSFGVEPQQREGRPEVANPEEAFRAIFGSDNRYYVSNTTYSPFNAIARLRMYRNGVDEGTCTGVYIGPWTMITAAHCLVYSDTMRANRIIFEPARNGATLPYGSYDCRLDDGTTSNDYVWSVPSGFYTGQNPDFDYAVIDTYPCHSAPAYMPGYQANAPDASFNVYGYPGMTCPGAPGGGTYQCGMYGSAYVNGPWLESEYIDVTSGQSGGPWFRYYSGTGYKPVGTHSGYYEYHDFFRCGFDPCKRNSARRIDNAYSQFIINVAWDF